MIAHTVLFRPRPDLTTQDVDDLITAFQQALRDINEIRRASIGRRIRIGRDYEHLMAQDFPFAAILEFDDTAALRSMGWTLPPLTGIYVPKWKCLSPLKREGASTMKVTTIGLDLAKNVFQVHGSDAHGVAVLRKQLRRAQLSEFFAQQPPCKIGRAHV